MAYKTEKLNLQPQAIAGPRIWFYSDTGSVRTDLPVATGFFTDGKTKGMKVGDLLYFTNANGGDAARFVVDALQAQDTGVQFASVSDTA
jgi:hypothetical protein